MSVAASNNEEAEALRRAQRAHEPSMEEILASIRAIIADDRESPRESPRDAKPGPQVVYLGEAARVTAPEPEVAPPVAVTPTVVWSRPAPEDFAPRREPPAAQESLARPRELSGASEDSALPRDASVPPEDLAALLSLEAESSVADSFHALSETMAAQGLRAAEDMAREMLRPMIKSWLDENLPPLVERLVRAEIQRVTRGGR